MTPSLVATLPGAFACTLLLFGVIAVVCVAWEACYGAWQRWRDDRRMRRGFRAARRYGLFDDFH